MDGDTIVEGAGSGVDDVDAVLEKGAGGGVDGG